MVPSHLQPLIVQPLIVMLLVGADGLDAGILEVMNVWRPGRC